MQYKNHTVSVQKFQTQKGEVINHLIAKITVYGQITSQKPIALVYHAFSTNSLLHEWWDKFNLAKLAQKYTIICCNSLGSSHGSTGPSSVNPETGQKYGLSFPKISIQDTVNFQKRALLEFGISQVSLVLGCSLGGMQALDMYLRFPNFAEKWISVAGVPVPYMTKLDNLAQSQLIETAAKAADEENLLNMLMHSRFFFRLACTSEQALKVLANRQQHNPGSTNLERLERYFTKDNLQFKGQFSPYSNSLYLRMIAEFELNNIEPANSNAPELVMVTMQDDRFTPKTSVKEVAESLHGLGYSVRVLDFTTAFGHEAWIIDGTRFYEFIEKELYQPTNMHADTSQLCTDMC